MFWSGFPWAVLTAYLKPSPLNGFGITFAVLFFLIVPAVERSNHIVSPMVWACALWIIVCLVVLVVVLANLYHGRDKARPTPIDGKQTRAPAVGSSRGPQPTRRRFLLVSKFRQERGGRILYGRRRICSRS